MTLSFHDQTVLVTGGNSGIGLATAQLFVERGGRALVCGRDADTLEQARRTLGERGHAVMADVGRLDEIDRLAAEARRFAPRLDLLFVNAGVGLFQPVEDVDEPLYDRMMDVNLKGAFFTIQKLLPLIPAGGSIVVNTSVAGSKGFPNTVVYSATKAALRSMVRTLAAELAPREVRVNAVAPGPIETPIYARMGLGAEQAAAMKHGFAQTTLLKRLGTAVEVAEAVLFLGSAAASYITGVELTVDGGLAQV